MMRPPPLVLRCGSASRDIRAKKSSERCTAVAHCSSVGISGIGERRPAGVVHEDVEAAEALHRRGDQSHG